MTKWYVSLVVAALVRPTLLQANSNQPLEHPFTLRNTTPYRVEAEYHRMAAGTGPSSFIFPRPCLSPLDSSVVCEAPGGWGFADSTRRISLHLDPVVGFEYRYLDENVYAGDFGIITQGQSGPVSFFLDARMYTESHENPNHISYDREFVERQDEEASGSVAYSSFSRFRSNLDYDWSWGRLSVARDAAHWGPGLFSNLTFHQGAIPFNQITFTTHLGPLTVQSLYGQLGLDTNWESDTSDDFRSIYGHRYELRATENLVLGISEQLILYRHEAPFAFVPLVPLFIAKAGEKERLNNGNIAGDAAYRIPGLGTIYSEFLIDDLQSPGSLFDDNWGNKWAWMAGFHVVHDWAPWQSGLIGEYSRVEPWVYTHKVPHTAQTANFDTPLGNPNGPNSQSLVAKAYLRDAALWYGSLRLDLVWKGTDAGSSMQDSINREGTKIFLGGVAEPMVELRPYLCYRWKDLAFFGEAWLGHEKRVIAGVQYLH